MIRCLTREKREKRGFTMMEVLVVVGIIAVIAAIAIPSVISMRKNMDYKQRCDYAKTIFLAAQSNLADLRSTGELKLVEDASNSHGAVLQQEDAEKAETEEGGTTGNLPGGFVSRYIYTANSGGTADDRYAQVLPVNAVESTIRDQNVIIEYNPRTGIVHAVFYAEGNYDLLGNYQKGMLKRDEQWLKENLVGYYGTGDADVSEELGFKTVSPEITFENGQEAILTVKIPTRTDKSNEDPFFLPDKYGYYVKGLEINLTVAGENSGVFTKNLKKAGVEMQPGEIDADEGAALVIPLHFALDSLADGKGFYDIPENKDGEGYHVLPGDNVSLFVEVSYVPTSQNDPLIMYDDAVLAGVNPLFHALTGEAPNYTVAISNGRHLQNLNALHSDIAGKVNTVTFLAETAGESAVVDWASTVSYYQQNHAAENLKCFVPIENNGLFNRGTENSLLIKGDNAVISNLKIIDTTPEKYVGLFRTLNGVNLENLRIVDPVIRGGDAAKAQKGVGTLAGSIQNSEVTNCYVYVDVSPADFNWSHLDTGDGFGGDSTTEQHYGVIGRTAVGGMVGYSDDVDFENCFAAVPVFGDMRNASGDAVGVGGFVGEANNGEFIKCYTSARTLADGVTYNKSGMHGSCGLGGFVGTSVNAKYINCFASGNVTSYTTGADAREVSGGFVGVAIRENNDENGLFNSCYALGTVRNKDGGSTQQAKFVGKSYSGTGLEKHDFYKDLLDSNNSGYIFRDCYYLQGKSGVVNADDYTLPASFDMLYRIYGLEYSEEYLMYVCTALNMLSVDKYEDINKDTLNKIGSQFQSSGFYKNTNWNQGLASKNAKGHYPYNEGYKKHGANYPYSMLTGMPFYGTWPDAPSDMGIVYWEVYSDGIGFYYDQMKSMTLQDKTVLADGYMIISANGGREFTVKFNDGTSTEKTVNVPMASTITLGNTTYYCGPIPANIGLMPNSFYAKMEVSENLSGSAKKYTMYYNPNVAASQISPAGNSVAAQNPGDYVPDGIAIHTARQLTALSGDAMKPFWNRNYVLYGTVDYDRYGISNETYADYFTQYGIATQQFTSVGDEQSPFTGTLKAYSGTASINVNNADTGLFGVLSGGKVSGITITGSMTLYDNEGALVNVMDGGTLENCVVAAVITSNSETAGLVVGKLNGGTISNCKSTGANERLAFVGNTTNPAKVAIDTTATHSGAAKFEDGIYTPDEIKELKPVEGSEKVTEYTCTITEDCTYVKHGSVVPAVKNTYYYSVSDKNTYMQSETPATEFVAESGIKLSRFGTDESGWKPAGLYYQLMGRYLPVSVKIEKNTETIYPSASVEDTGSADNSETDASEPESSEATVTPEPEIKTTYTYTFGYELNDNYIPLSGDKVTENPDSYTITDMTLYSLKEPQKNSTYILVSGTQALKADDSFADINSGIVAEMVWTVGEEGNWYIGEKTIKVTLNIPDTGASQYPKVKVGEMEYQAYAVELTTAREVKLVNQDSVYATTYQPAEND